MKQRSLVDSPIFQFLSRVADLMIVNVLFLICCLPVVTVGASLAGLNKVAQNISLGKAPSVVKTFFRAFRGNFKQATVVWLALALIAASLVCDRLLIDTFLAGGTLATVLRGFVWVVALACLAVASYLYPLIVRYDNGLRQHIQNAMILTIYKLPRTLALVVLNAAPFALLYFSVIGFLKSLAFWVIIGCGVIAYLDSALLSPVLAQLEKRDKNEPVDEPD